MLSVSVDALFGTFRLNVNFEAGNETLALLGASGCGKSMTLKAVAGIITPDTGRIVLNGRVLFDSSRRISLPPQKRRCGLMFQNYALFPQMTAEQNIYAGTSRLPESERRKEAESMLEAFGLMDLRGHYPHQLSGGQQQRVALARMLVSRPEVIMLDEPFSALDTHLRFRTEQEVRKVIRDFAGTVIVVSHDRDEVFRFADRIAVMSEGRIEAAGTKHEIFADPKTRTAAVLTGCKNISRAERISDGEIYAADWGIRLSLHMKDYARFAGIRMHDIEFAGDSDGENIFACNIAEVVENAFSFVVMLTPLDAPEGNMLIGWEMAKDEWRKIHSGSGMLRVQLPAHKILQLS